MYRGTEFYEILKADTYQATGLAEGFIEPSEDGPDAEEQVLTAWQVLHDTGLAYQLQGFFGRTVSSLIQQGLVED